VSNPAAAVKDSLTKNIMNQQIAIHYITNAINVWFTNRNSDESAGPLVMAFAGKTGVGKTQSARLIAEALLKDKITTGGADRAKGLVMLRGEDYMEGTPLTQVISDIKMRIINKLRDCNFNAVVVFDEIQKVQKGTLDALVEAMGESGFIQYFDNNDHSSKTGKLHQMSTRNVVFILITDVGTKEVDRMLVNKRGDRALISQAEVQKVVKLELDKQWKKIKFAGLVDKVIPFLPFQREDLVRILCKYLSISSVTFFIHQSR
jgi:ATP-dependent Clp protease ATP-binding subunit ClpA